MILRRITARQDPRWLPFMRELGHAPEQLAKIAFTVAVPGAAAPAGVSSSAVPRWARHQRAQPPRRPRRRARRRRANYEPRILPLTEGSSSLMRIDGGGTA